MAIDPSQIKLSPEQRAILARLAEKSGKPWAEVFSEALHSYHSYRPANGSTQLSDTARSFYDLMNEDGVVGIVKDAPPDLSTNSHHMEGIRTWPVKL